MAKLMIAAAVACALACGLCDTSFAQYGAGYQAPRTTAQKSYQAPVAPSAPYVAASGSRPFDNTSRRPSVSPYLNLLNNQNPNVTNYQSLVRPMVNQNRVNAQSRSAINNLQNAPSSSPQGSENMRSTGHQSAFGNYSHYYPGLKH